MKYFKIDKDKREIIIDKTKHYNVNVDILDLMIDLQLEYYEGVKDEEKHLKPLLNNAIKAKDKEIESQKRVINGMIDNEEQYCLEINRLNNIIKRFEDDLREMYLTFGEFSEEYTEKRIQELKESDEE